MKTTPIASSRDLIATRTISRPNGQPVYPNGWLPQDHDALFLYPDCIRSLTGDVVRGYRWKVVAERGDRTLEALTAEFNALQ